MCSHILLGEKITQSTSHHHTPLVVKGPSTVDEVVYFFSREWRSLPAIRLRGRHHIDMGQQHVGDQVRLGALHSEQVAEVGHHFMLNQARTEHCWES